METIDEKRVELEHMECRVQWHRSHQERIEALRLAIQAAELKRPLKDDELARCRVSHKH